LKHAEIYQEQLANYFAQKLTEFAKENKLLHEKYNAQNTFELQALQSEITKHRNEVQKLYIQENSLKDKLDDLQPMQRGLPPLRSTNVVRSNNVYATTWYESGWMNIDLYLKYIDKNAIDVDIYANVNNTFEHIKIYQCINSLQTLIPLRLENNRATAKFPSANHPEAKNMSDTYAIGVQWDIEGNLLLAEQAFNPYEKKSLQLAWEKVTPQEFRKRLSILDYTKDLLKHVENQEKIIAKIQVIKQKKGVSIELPFYFQPEKKSTTSYQDSISV
jgi:hypothetical protein